MSSTDAQIFILYSELDAWAHVYALSDVKSHCLSFEAKMKLMSFYALLCLYSLYKVNMQF